MATRVVRLGTPRKPGEGLRIDTVRHSPCGVRKKDFARRDFFDVWLPELAPSAPLVSWLLSEPIAPKRWADFARRYRREMLKPPAQRVIALLAALSSQSNFSVIATAKTSPTATRSLLKKLVIEQSGHVV
jgi:uncharacterized protein YeaO (DUF488 family)